MTWTLGRTTDLDTLEDLWLTLYDHHRALGGAGLPVIPREQSWAVRRPAYVRMLKQGASFLTAVDGTGEVIGYCVLRFHEGPSAIWDLGAVHGEVEDIAVRPAYRGSGVGAALLAEAESECATRGITVVRLTAMTGNDRALGFYRSRGWSPYLETLSRTLG